jgi:hypothetical protein
VAGEKVAELALNLSKGGRWASEQVAGGWRFVLLNLEILCVLGSSVVN